MVCDRFNFALVIGLIFSIVLKSRFRLSKKYCANIVKIFVIQGEAA